MRSLFLAAFIVAVAASCGSSKTCTWSTPKGDVVVELEEDRDCGPIIGYLDQARAELAAAHLVVPALLDLHMVKGSVRISAGAELTGLFDGKFGSYDNAGREVVLERYMRAALHELFHAYEDATGVSKSDSLAHKNWKTLPGLQEADSRFWYRVAQEQGVEP